MLITNLISRYMKLCKAAFSAGDGAKLNKSIQTNVMEMLFLLMVTPRKCNFTQMGRLQESRVVLVSKVIRLTEGTCLTEYCIINNYSCSMVMVDA